jgi:DNA-binding MarR family transcriptional regulator
MIVRHLTKKEKFMLHDRIANKITQLTRTMKREKERFFDEFLKDTPYADMKLTESNVRILKILSSGNHNLYVQKDIEEQLDVRASTVSGILNTMESKGLIIRKSDFDDGRIKRISLTALGQELETKIDAFIAGFENRIDKVLTKEERIELSRLLDKLKAEFKS